MQGFWRIISVHTAKTIDSWSMSDNFSAVIGKSEMLLSMAPFAELFFVFLGGLRGE
jgi:hypothetical protein